MVDLPPRRSLRTNQMSRGYDGSLWQYIPPNVVAVTDDGDEDGDQGLEPPESPPESPPAEPETQAARVESTPEPQHHRRRRR